MLTIRPDTRAAVTAASRDLQLGAACEHEARQFLLAYPHRCAHTTDAGYVLGAYAACLVDVRLEDAAANLAAGSEKPSEILVPECAHRCTADTKWRADLAATFDCLRHEISTGQVPSLTTHAEQLVLFRALACTIDQEDASGPRPWHGVFPQPHDTALEELSEMTLRLFADPAFAEMADRVFADPQGPLHFDEDPSAWFRPAPLRTLTAPARVSSPSSVVFDHALSHCT